MRWILARTAWEDAKGARGASVSRASGESVARSFWIACGDGRRHGGGVGVVHQLRVRRSIPRAFGLAAALGAAVCLPLRAHADDRLAGYWVPAPGEPPTAAFSFGILGRWTIVAAHWDGSAPDFKVRYTAVTAGDKGTLSADEKLDRQPEAPSTINYQIKGGELFLAIPDTTHAGRYRLVKGVPPSTASAAAPAPPRERSPGPPRRPVALPRNPNDVLGSWATEPGAPVEVDLFIGMTGPASVKINQQWIKGGEGPVVSRGTEYKVTFSSNGHGTFSREAPEYEGSEIPLRLDYGFEGDALIVTVDNGAFAGQYRLTKKAK